MARLLLRHVGRDHVHPAVAVGQRKRRLGKLGRVAAVERGHQRTLASAHQRQRMGKITVR